MFSRFRTGLDNAPSVARVAEEENLTYAEAADKLMRQGKIPATDPRLHLNPIRVRAFSERRMDELVQDFTAVARSQQAGAAELATRVKYAAAIKAGGEHFDALRNPAVPRGQAAAGTEAIALSMMRTDPKNPAAQQLLEISAACSDRAMRERAMQGFDTRDGIGNIAKAAKSQGRSWLDVRDDLVKFNVLKRDDPRRKVRKADVELQKSGTIMRSNTLPAEELEMVAMRRLKKDPKDELGMAWLCTTGALAEVKPARKVMGAEVQGVVPAKAGLFSSKSKARRRAIDMDLG